MTTFTKSSCLTACLVGMMIALVPPCWAQNWSLKSSITLFKYMYVRMHENQNPWRLFCLLLSGLICWNEKKQIQQNRKAWNGRGSEKPVWSYVENCHAQQNRYKIVLLTKQNDKYKQTAKHYFLRFIKFGRNAKGNKITRKKATDFKSDLRSVIEIKVIELWCFFLLLFKYLKTSQRTFSANFKSHKKDFYSLTHETLESVSSSQTRTNPTKAMVGSVQLS